MLSLSNYPTLSYGGNPEGLFDSSIRQQLRSHWMEQLDGTAKNKRVRKDLVTMKQERATAKEALLQVCRNIM